MRELLDARAVPFVLVAFAVPLLTGCPEPVDDLPVDVAIDTAAVEQAIDELRVAFVEAYNAGEAGEVAALYAEDAVFLPADAPAVHGRDAIRENLDEALAHEPTLEVESHEVIPLSPEWTSSGGVYRVEVTPEGADEPVVTEGSYLLLLRQIDEEWKLFRHASTLDAPPE